MRAASVPAYCFVVPPPPRVSLALVVFCAVTQQVDYLFAENGLVAYKNGELLSVQVNTILSTGLVEHLNLVPILLVMV